MNIVAVKIIVLFLLYTVAVGIKYKNVRISIGYCAVSAPSNAAVGNSGCFQDILHKIESSASAPIMAAI